MSHFLGWESPRGGCKDSGAEGSLRLAELGPPDPHKSKSVTQGCGGQSWAIAPRPWFPHSGASRGRAPDERGCLGETLLFLEMLVIRPPGSTDGVCGV